MGTRSIVAGISVIAILCLNASAASAFCYGTVSAVQTTAAGGITIGLNLLPHPIPCTCNSGQSFNVTDSVRNNKILATALTALTMGRALGIDETIGSPWCDISGQVTIY